MKTLGQKDFATGALFLAAALFFGLQSWSYDLGTAAQMGPGFFPILLSGCLALVGLFYCAKALYSAGPPVPALHLRPLAALIGGILAFGLLVADFGLVVAIFGMTFVGSLGGYRYRWWELGLLSVLLAFGSALVFVYGLNVRIPVWPKL